MAKYSDHSTIGGQVLTHRIRMIQQDVKIIFLSGKITFIISYLGYLFIKFHLCEIWDYFCIVKSRITRNWIIFDGSYITDYNWNFRYIKDYMLRQDPVAQSASKELDMFWMHDLWISLFLVMCTVSIIHKRIGRKLTENKEILSGHDFVNSKDLKKLIKAKSNNITSDITVAGIPYPKGAEMRHTLITGTTGCGKTNAIIEILDQVQKCGNRAIIVDTVGTYVNRYYNKERGDIILNPFDPRSTPWSFFEECKDKEIMRNVASCLIEKGDSHDKFWEEAGKIVFIETAIKAQADNKTLKEFLELLVKAPLKEAEKYLKDTMGSNFVAQEVDKMAISIRATLVNAIYSFETLKESKENNFSIQNWINSDQKNFLFLSCSPKERNTVIPLITAWLSIASDFLMQNTETDNRTWFFIDELHNLKKLPKLDLALAEIRKFGGCYVMGTQLISQLEKIYGHDLTRTITGLCGTKIVMNVPEPITAKYMADFLGEKEEITSLETLSYGANTMRDGANISQRYAKENVVSGAQIMDLTTGSAFIRFYGIPIVGKIQFELHRTNNSYTSKISLPENSKIIDISEKSEKEIKQILEFLRARRKHAIILDKEGTITNKFAKNIDIIINPINGNYSWDILGDFGNEPIPFMNTILANNKQAQQDFNLQEQIIQQFTKLDNAKEILNSIISLNEAFSWLSICVNSNQKVKITDYLNSTGESLMFISCNDNADLTKMANVMSDYITSKNLCYVVSNFTPN